jgi:hypothetical protein
MERDGDAQPMGFWDLWYPYVVGVVAGGGEFEVGWLIWVVEDVIVGWLWQRWLIRNLVMQWSFTSLLVEDFKVALHL